MPRGCGTHTWSHTHCATYTLIGPLDSALHTNSILIGLKQVVLYWVFTCPVAALGTWGPLRELCADLL